MPSPNLSTFDVVPPYRPGAADFNGAVKIDDSENPPNPVTMPSAAEYNTLCLLLVALGKIVPVVSVSISGGASPAVIAFACAGSAVVIGTFTVTYNAVGNVTITWPVGTLPPPVGQPMATLNVFTAGMITARNVANGVQVKTFDATGASADRDFTVQAF